MAEVVASDGRRTMRAVRGFSAWALRGLVAGGLLAGAFGSVGGANAATAKVWLTSRTTAVVLLKSRFPNIASVACTPDAASTTQVAGTTRYWHSFYCTGATYEAAHFALLFTATGQCSACWTITHLTGTDAAGLRVPRGAAAPPQGRRVSPGTLSGGGLYPSTGMEHRITNTGGGSVITLEDGSLWLVDPLSRIYTNLWLPFETVVVENEGMPGYPYTLVNTRTGSTAYARFLSFG